jgi:hypothetical protein
MFLTAVPLGGKIGTLKSSTTPGCQHMGEGRSGIFFSLLSVCTGHYNGYDLRFYFQISVIEKCLVIYAFLICKLKMFKLVCELCLCRCSQHTQSFTGHPCTLFKGLTNTNDTELLHSSVTREWMGGDLKSGTLI